MPPDTHKLLEWIAQFSPPLVVNPFTSLCTSVSPSSPRPPFFPSPPLLPLAPPSSPRPPFFPYPHPFPSISPRPLPPLHLPPPSPSPPSPPALCLPLRPSFPWFPFPSVQDWESAYGLANGSLSPPAALAFPPGVPPAPHLEDCAARTAARARAEARGPNGEAPAWARAGECCQCSAAIPPANCTPQTPWIRGSDAANLGQTRTAQRDLWANQFPAPPDCTGRRLALTFWATLHHGLGSQLHIMSSFLSLAVRFNRTLVIKPDTFNRATQACRDLGLGNNLECYFFPLGAPACLEVALAAEARGEVVNSDGVAMEERERILGSDALVVQLANTGLFGEVSATDLWGAPSLDRPLTIQQLGRIQGQYFAWGQARWWRAQALRFMLRWPSPHLCHATNRMRHSAYGLLVADRVASVVLKQAELLQSINASAATGGASSGASSTVPPASSQPPLVPSPSADPADDLRFLSSSPITPPPSTSSPSSPPLVSPPPTAAPPSTPSTPSPPSLASHIWPLQGLSGCSSCSSTNPPTQPTPPPQSPQQSTCTWAESARVYQQVGAPPFMLRPVISMHVRQGDKGIEMTLHSLATFVFFAYRMRRHRPDLQYIWLSSEMESVMAAAETFPDWTFLYASSSRATDVEQMKQQQFSGQQPIAEIFANLLITSESDYFIGSLGSNWNRVIDELRSTGGKLFGGLVTLTHGV
ncbi:unnamed protein product [Closterium sp. Naga37s-1]|nr:unnamed protein product [Closterium sp. Naga37s-1]